MGEDVIEIREMGFADLDEVTVLETAHQPRPWSRELFASELATGSRRLIVAVDDGEVVGFGGVMVIGDEAHVTNLLVAPSHRRRRIGRKLLSRLVKDSVVMGAQHLTLEVRSGNKAARDLYARMGLAPVGVRKNYYGDDDAIILWAHDIDKPEFLERV